MEASVSFHHKSFTHINIHSKQQQVEVPSYKCLFYVGPSPYAPEHEKQFSWEIHGYKLEFQRLSIVKYPLKFNNSYKVSQNLHIHQMKLKTYMLWPRTFVCHNIT